MLENNLFQVLLDILPFKAYVVDIKTYEIIYANQEMKDSIYSSGDKNCFEVFYGQNKPCSWCSIKKLKSNIGNNHSTEFFDEVNDKWFVSHDRYTIWIDRQSKYSILVDITKQKENQGKLIHSHAKLSMYAKHLVIMNKNFQITKLLLQKKSDELKYININLEKTIEKQLLKLRKQDQLIFLQQKQFSLDNMMSLISHQWKQPLHELSINNIYLLETEKNKKNKKIYEDNNEIIQFLSSTINAFQDFYRSSHKNKFTLTEVIKSTILILNSSIRQYNITINFHYKDEQIELNGQRNIFSQVILSILENAISISVERNIKKPKVEIKIKVITNNLIIYIEDNAGGIDEENLPYIFDNTKSFRKKTSSGIGLYIANLIIVEKFNGTISAGNTEEGAIFTIVIPL
jgi:signal transduction histidine kinase